MARHNTVETRWILASNEQEVKHGCWQWKRAAIGDDRMYWRLQRLVNDGGVPQRLHNLRQAVAQTQSILSRAAAISSTLAAWMYFSVVLMSEWPKSRISAYRLGGR